MRLKGFTRSRTGAVLNTETTEFELIRQRRATKRGQDQVQAELNQLREMVTSLTKRVEELERG